MEWTKRTRRQLKKAFGIDVSNTQDLPLGYKKTTQLAAGTLRLSRFHLAAFAWEVC